MSFEGEGVSSSNAQGNSETAHDDAKRSRTPKPASLQIKILTSLVIVLGGTSIIVPVLNWARVEANTGWLVVDGTYIRQSRGERRDDCGTQPYLCADKFSPLAG